MASMREQAEAIDALVQQAYRAGEPGAAVIVVKEGQPLYRGAVGLAQVELGVPLAPEMIFRLASITKQFTAVAVLMLMEQGKLELSDSLTRFLPDYPTHGHTITVEHLLTHTSGIRSYTDMEEWRSLWSKDFTVAELTDFFKYKPMQFAPGTRWAYNNSGYHLLGSIIEQVSGQPYGQFLQQHIFEPLGMRHSCYDDTRRIIPNRVAGYEKTPDGYLNSTYLSMTQPYAAGALLSTVDDLALWDRSLADATLISRENLKRAWSPYILADGSPTDYGYGWGVGTWQGRATAEHSGGIHGFSTFALRVPDEQVFVAVLSNNAGGPNTELLALRLAGLAMGAPYEPPAPVELDAASLDALAGVYALPEDATWTITREGGQLKAERSGWGPLTLNSVGESSFVVDGMPLFRVVFAPGTEGKPDALELHGRSGLRETATRAEGSAATAE
jgi:D-alanyl-D-alanine carboxypeptidase